jgi:hypothetical protein
MEREPSGEWDNAVSGVLGGYSPCPVRIGVSERGGVT